MSLLVWKISKLPLSKKLFSSCFSTKATTLRSKPYLLVDDYYQKFILYDPTTNKEVVTNLKIQNQSKTLRTFDWIGSSRGYLAIQNRKDSSIDLVEIDSKTKRKIISLPQLHFDRENCGGIVNNVSVSSPVVDGGDVIVAVKLSGSRLSLCRVGDSEWTEIDIPYEFFNYSCVIYSERDKRFYLNNLDKDCTDQIDLTPKSGLVTPPVIGYPFPISSVPEEYEKFSHLTVGGLDGIQEQLVESPSGELFLVAWATHYINEDDTHMMVVYKQDEEEEICSFIATKDIGDLCIFVGDNEAFCVSANEYPGLKPNSVYFDSYLAGVGIWDLASQTTLHLPHKSLCYRLWIPPILTS